MMNLKTANKWMPRYSEEKMSKVGRLENGLVYLIQVYDQNNAWSVEMSGLSARSQDMHHSYIFSKGFDIDQVLSEAEHMYRDFILGMRN